MKEFLDKTLGIYVNGERIACTTGEMAFPPKSVGGVSRLGPEIEGTLTFSKHHYENDFQYYLHRRGKYYFRTLDGKKLIVECDDGAMGDLNKFETYTFRFTV